MKRANKQGHLQVAGVKRQPNRRQGALLVCLMSLPLGCQREANRGSGRELVIFAAASLGPVFANLREPFERRHPGARISFNFAGSQELRTQIHLGANADVFAAASEVHVNHLAQTGRLDTPVVFATNQLVVIFSSEAPHLKTFADVARAARVVVGSPEVPIGAYTERVLSRADAQLGAGFGVSVKAHIVSREHNVRHVLMKVILAEAEAGFVYRTDAMADRQALRVVPIPSEFNVVATYPVAVVSQSRQPELARAWVGWLLSAESQAVLRSAGFGPAEATGDL